MDTDRKDGMNARQLRDLADSVFTKKAALNSFHQEVAEHFYPERADFTIKRTLSEDFAGSITTSYTTLCRRDLGDQIGTMLRNTNKPWFHMVASDMRREDHAAKTWLEWASGTMRRAMYAPQTLFTRATSQGDHDFAAFGQCVITVRLNRDADDLLFRCWHLRDVAWIENEDGKLCAIFRRWKPTYRQLVRMFDRPGASVHRKVLERAKKVPHEEIECYHFMVACDMYDGDDKGVPWRSVYYDCQNQHEMESVAQKGREYVIPRWLTVSGSQYAHSPATVAALPESRLLQAMTATLLEAGEKVVNPPIIATEQAVRSDVGLYAGAITWVDREYDERLGDALRPLLQDSRGMPLSMDMQRDSRALLAQCFYLNKLTLPMQAGDMTATEVSQRVQEYIRNALPLFEPMEATYNGELCEEVFDVMLRSGGFGSPYDMPESLRDADVRFRFASPLHDTIEQQKGQKMLEVSQLLAQAAAMDKSVYGVVDAKVAFRDALAGIGVPTKWTRSEQVVRDMEEQQAAQAQAQQMLATLQSGADVADTLASARKQMAEAA